AYWASTLTPIDSTSAFTSLRRAGFSRIRAAPSGPSVDSIMNFTAVHATRRAPGPAPCGDTPRLAPHDPYRPHHPAHPLGPRVVPHVPVVPHGTRRSGGRDDRSAR